MLKILLHKLLLTKKKHAEPKGEETIHAPENCTTQNIFIRSDEGLTFETSAL